MTVKSCGLDWGLTGLKGLGLGSWQYFTLVHVTGSAWERRWEKCEQVDASSEIFYLEHLVKAVSHVSTSKNLKSFTNAIFSSQSVLIQPRLTPKWLKYSLQNHILTVWVKPPKCQKFNFKDDLSILVLGCQTQSQQLNVKCCPWCGNVFIWLWLV